VKIKTWLAAVLCFALPLTSSCGSQSEPVVSCKPGGGWLINGSATLSCVEALGCHQDRNLISCPSDVTYNSGIGVGPGGREQLCCGESCAECDREKIPVTERCEEFCSAATAACPELDAELCAINCTEETKPDTELARATMAWQDCMIESPTWNCSFAKRGFLTDARVPGICHDEYVAVLATMNYTWGCSSSSFEDFTGVQKRCDCRLASGHDDGETPACAVEEEPQCCYLLLREVSLDQPTGLACECTSSQGDCPAPEASALVCGRSAARVKHCPPGPDDLLGAGIPVQPTLGCSSECAESSRACVSDCSAPCGFGGLGTLACTCDNGIQYHPCSCPRPDAFQGAETAPLCGETGPTATRRRGAPCDTQWDECVEPAGKVADTLGCVCLPDATTKSLIWWCGPTNGWFAE